MRVHLMLPEVLGHGGIQRYNRHLVEAARAVVGRENVRAFSLNDESTPEFDGFRRNHARFTRYALGAITREQPDVAIIGHVNMAPLVLAARAMSPRTRFYVLCHGKEAEARLEWLQLAGMRAAHGVIAVSESTRLLTVRIQRIPASRVHVLHYGFEPSRAEGSADAGRGPIRLLSVARLQRGDRYKGIDRTLEAVARLQDAIPDLRYTVVGEGDDRPRLTRMATHLGIGARVYFAGELDEAELVRCYESCDIFVLPSTHEGLGIVYLEAMARGKPVIAVRAGGVADVVVHEANGLLVNAARPDAIAQAIEQLASDGELRTRLGQHGRVHTVPGFSSKTMERALESLLATAGTLRRVPTRVTA